MTDIDDSNFYVPEEAASRVRPEPIRSFYDVKCWPVTKECINDYSKIHEINRIHSYDNDLKHNEKLLLVEFSTKIGNYTSPIQTHPVTKSPSELVVGFRRNPDQTQYITHKLRIIQTVKEGTLICGNPLYPYLNLDSMEDALGIRSQRINYYNHLRSSNFKLCIIFDYYNPSKFSTCAKYTVRLCHDDLLNDIRRNNLQKNKNKNKKVPSLLQLCVSAIATRDLEQYNHMNRTMNLAM